VSYDLRTATGDDAAALFRIKGRLGLRQDGRGGFLLGTSERGYAALIEAAQVTVLCSDGQPVGFCVALPDAVLRASELWARRDQVDWGGFDPSAVEAAPVGYFDQLAVLPGHRRAGAVALALRGAWGLFSTGHAHLLATTVVAPVRNTAAIPLLARVGARRVGSIAEVYPEIGPLVSDLHLLARSDFQAHLAAARRSASSTLRRAIDVGLAGGGT
jgi:hypothetical protein